MDNFEAAFLEFLKEFKDSGRTDFPHFLNELINFIEDGELPLKDKPE